MSKNKNNILSKSRELFEQYGYQKTTLTDIAKSVGKVKTAIYYYFSGKEEIFAALVKSEAEDFNRKLFKQVEKVEGPIAKIELYVKTRMKLMQSLSNRYSFLKQEFFELMDIVEKNRTESDLKEIDYVITIFQEGVQKGEMNIHDIEFSAKMLVNTMKGLEIQMFVTDQLIVRKSEIPKFTHHILYGIISKI